MAPLLEERMRRMRIGLRELSRLSGVSPKTITGMAKSRHKTHPMIVKALDEAMSGQEISLRDYLVAMHGVPQGEGR